MYVRKCGLVSTCILSTSLLTNGILFTHQFMTFYEKFADLQLNQLIVLHSKSITSFIQLGQMEPPYRKSLV